MLCSYVGHYRLEVPSELCEALEVTSPGGGDSRDRLLKIDPFHKIRPQMNIHMAGWLYHQRLKSITNPYHSCVSLAIHTVMICIFVYIVLWNFKERDSSTYLHSLIKHMLLIFTGSYKSVHTGPRATVMSHSSVVTRVYTQAHVLQ